MPKRMAQYPKIESIGSKGCIILSILEVQVTPLRKPNDALQTSHLEIHDVEVIGEKILNHYHVRST